MCKVYSVHLYVQLSKAQDLDTLQNLLCQDSVADIVFASGFSKPITQVTLEDVPVILKALGINSCLVPVKAELDQVKEGLSIFNISQLIAQYPSEMKKLFVAGAQPAKLSVSDFIRLTEYHYSGEGSNVREKEESTTMHWNDFLMDVENGMAGMY